MAVPFDECIYFVLAVSLVWDKGFGCIFREDDVFLGQEPSNFITSIR
jgi:hypothetical protein